MKTNPQPSPEPNKAQTEETWEEEFESSFVHWYARGSVQWQEFKNNSPGQIKKLKQFITQALANERKRVAEEISEYVEHDKKCILANCSGGRPIYGKNDIVKGYQVKYGNKWYMTRPTDETPKCQCGLDGVLQKHLTPTTGEKGDL